jgi:RHH-type proline utilization regulon transcriptional repressor/proline dehydrogenase/delta 1-pyrroline-5-carboxylate dehydrogenase
VLQAYLPDSHEASSGSVRGRRSSRAGGGTAKVRLVKGASLAMETVEAERTLDRRAVPVEGRCRRQFALWIQRSYPTGQGVAVRLASHNLLDVAWAVYLADEFGAHERIEFEMLEGWRRPRHGRCTRPVAC